MECFPLTDLTAAFSYTRFRQMADQELERGAPVDNPGAQALLAYTRQNVQRMKRWDRTLALESPVTEKLQLLPGKVLMLTLVESWCGDVSQVVPVIEKMAQAAPERLTHRLLFRDQHPHIMDAFLTQGARSIPKVIFLDPADRRVLGAWGPRPSEAQAMVMDFKATEAQLPDEERAEFRRKTIEAIHAWYARDKGRRTALECTNALWQAAHSRVSVSGS